MKVKKRPPVVEVEWDDAYSSSAWKDEEAMKAFISNGCHCLTVGYLIHKDAKMVVVATSIGPDSGAPWSIPMGCVTKMRFLRK